MPAVVLAPSHGDSRALEYYRRAAERYGDPRRTTFLTDEPVRLHDLNKLAAMQSAIAAGTATPGEIAAFRRDQHDRAARMDGYWDHLAEVVEQLAGERLLIFGFWPQQYTLVERLRARGHGTLSVAPDSVLAAGGGSKGVTLPGQLHRSGLRVLRPGPVPGGGRLRDVRAVGLAAGDRGPLPAPAVDRAPGARRDGHRAGRR